MKTSTQIQYDFRVNLTTRLVANVTEMKSGRIRKVLSWSLHHFVDGKWCQGCASSHADNSTLSALKDMLSDPDCLLGAEKCDELLRVL